jgi:8-oxo-dGTP pyrophosphatase MutT (NUDIX family)
MTNIIMPDSLSSKRSSRHWRTAHISNSTSCIDVGCGKIHSANVIPHFIGKPAHAQRMVELANPAECFCSCERPCSLDRPKKRQEGKILIDEWCIHNIALEWDPKTNQPVDVLVPKRHGDLLTEWESSYRHTAVRPGNEARMTEAKAPLNCYVIDVLQMVTEKLATSKLWRVDPSHDKFSGDKLYYFVTLASGDGTEGNKRFGTKHWRGPSIQIIGGKVEHSRKEMAVEAARREFREETHEVFCQGQFEKFDGYLDKHTSIQVAHVQYCAECTSGTKPDRPVGSNKDGEHYKCGCVAYRNMYIFPYGPVNLVDFERRKT